MAIWDLEEQMVKEAEKSARSSTLKEVLEIIENRIKELTSILYAPEIISRYEGKVSELKNLKQKIQSLEKG